MPDAAAKLSVLVACPECRRRYDASDLPLGALFHCHCGHLVKVPDVTAKDATVVRCSACGAPRLKDATACEHCRADFTAHERDMHTTCPECMARISDRARFCHHCGVKVGSRAPAGRPTEHRCPACDKRPQLTHRELGRPPIPALECPCCAGLWLSPDAMESVIERSRAKAPPEGGNVQRADAPRQRGPLYRRCPICDTMMARVNHGRRSGVIVDRCNDHGIWFDEQELAAIVAWVRGGGERRAEQIAQQEARAAASRERFGPAVTAGRTPDKDETWETPLWLEVLGSLMSGSI